MRDIKEANNVFTGWIGKVVSGKVTLSSLEPVDDSATAARKRH